ncbi:MAG: hypothetical protein M9890_00730 [Thermomicrobiales bacterium]|nr:hypothetical protein [Thermomicrobiales bacterium]
MNNDTNTPRRDIRRKDIEPLMERAEDRAPDGDLPDDAQVSNDDLPQWMLDEAAAGSGDDDDDIPEHLWPAEGADTLGEYTRRISESIDEAVDRLPDPENSPK